MSPGSTAGPRWDDPDVEAVAPGIHRVPVPLPEDGLRAVNVYVVEDEGGITLVDAGWDGPEPRAAIDRGLAAAGAELHDVSRILITHAHYDHIGQATSLRRAGAGAWWLGEEERGTFTHLTTDPHTSRLIRYSELIAHGGRPLVEEGRSGVDAPSHPVDWDEPDRWLLDGDRAPLSDGGLDAIHTPGHTRGHLCFVHAGRRILFAGDHVLPHITPSLGLEAHTNHHALIDYIASLARVRALDVDLVLPAHGPVFHDLAKRVDELTAHHEVRLDQCLKALGTGTANAYEIAQLIPWTRRDTPFSELNRFNRVLATWETAAHLELLAARGDITSKTVDDVVVWCRPEAD